MKKLRVIVACEYSGRVRDAFIRGGMMRYRVTCLKVSQILDLTYRVIL